MTGSRISSSMPHDDDRRGPAALLDGQGTQRPADTVDPLTRQLRQMYGAIAEEPIPAEIETLLRRLRGN